MLTLAKASMLAGHLQQVPTQRTGEMSCSSTARYFTMCSETVHSWFSSYLSQADAKAQNLTYVNEAGNAVIKVDNVTASTDPTYGRSSIYMVSTGTFYEGSLVIFSATHMPYGCGVCKRQPSILLSAAVCLYVRA